LDLIYSTFFAEPERSARVQSAIYDHGFLPNFAGTERWGRASYRFYTNSLGLKDGAVRDVPLRAPMRRVVVIGDSFTEGLGMPHENTFVGLLNGAGQKSARKTEFLNAGVSGYSAAVYYRKIRYLIDSGLQFDEVLVAVDAGEVPREASGHFCVDEDP